MTTDIYQITPQSSELISCYGCWDRLVYQQDKYGWNKYCL